MNSIDKAALRRSFDRAARRYDADADLQRAVARRLIAFAASGDPPRRPSQISGRILDAGAGSGFGVAALARAFPGACVVAVDFARKMLEITRRKFPRAECVCADVDELPFASGVFDLVFSSSVLQWSEDVETAAEEFRRVLKQGALLLLASYTAGTLRELRDSWCGIDDSAHTLEFPAPHRLRRALEAAGMSVSLCRTQTEVVLYDGVGALLENLKSTGVRNLRRDRGAGLTTPSRLEAMKARYRARHAAARGTPASYTVTLISAHAGGPCQDG